MAQKDWEPHLPYGSTDEHKKEREDELGADQASARAGSWADGGSLAGSGAFEEEWFSPGEQVQVGTLRETLELSFSDPFASKAISKESFEYYGISRFARVVAVMTILVTAASTLCLVLETLPQYYHHRGEGVWAVLEAFFIAFFTAETVARFCVTSSAKGFFRNVLNLLDIASVVPYYSSLIAGTRHPGFSLRILRLFRAISIIRAIRLSEGLETNAATIAMSLRKSQEVLTLYLCVLVVTVVVWSSAIYYLERTGDTQWDSELQLLVRVRRLRDVSEPLLLEDFDAGKSSATRALKHDVFVEEVSPFQSIVHSFWWCMTTLATVGYGDDVPSSIAGKLVAGLTMISGIFVLALPTSILGSNFLRVYRDELQQDVQEPPPSEETGFRIDTLYAFLNNLHDSNLLGLNQAEYLRRACWCPEYRKRVVWAYRAAHRYQEAQYTKCEAKLRFIGVVMERGTLLCPEVERRFGSAALHCSFPEKSVLSFCVDWDPAGKTVVGLKDVKTVPKAYQEEALLGIAYRTPRLWLQVFEDRARSREEYVRQGDAVAELARIDLQRSTRFVQLAKFVIGHIEERSLNAKAVPLRQLYQTSSREKPPVL